MQMPNVGDQLYFPWMEERYVVTAVDTTNQTVTYTDRKALYETVPGRNPYLTSTLTALTNVDAQILVPLPHWNPVKKVRHFDASELSWGPLF